MLAAATVIAKHTSVLCNACKQASSKTTNPVAKKHFVQAAKEVANSTANLVKNIKVHNTCTLRWQVVLGDLKRGLLVGVFSKSVFVANFERP